MSVKNSKYQSIIDAVKKAAVTSELDEYELYLTSSESVECETFRDEISEFSSSNSGNLYFRCIKNGKLGYATTQSTDDNEIEDLVKRASENALINEKEETAIIYGGGEYKKIEKREFEFPKTESLTNLAMDMRNALYAADEDMTDGTAGGAMAYKSSVLIYNSKGLVLENEAGNFGGLMLAVVTDKESGVPEMAYKYVFESPLCCDKAEIAKQLSEKARSRFGAGNVKTGKYNIVFSRDCVAEILGTFAEVFFAENSQKGFSKLTKADIGTKIASDAVTLIDTPFEESNTMQIEFDGEGYPTREKKVIENGEFKTLLYNLTSAMKDGVESTGNASRSSSSIGTRVFSFYIAPGRLTDEELMSKAENGIFVTGMKGFHAGADAISGNFSIESEGFLIEGGKLSSPVRSFTVAGNFFELLKEIEEVSSELEFRGPGYTRIAGPAFLVRDMSVAGE